MVVSVRVGTDNGLVSWEMLGTKFLAQCLRPVYGQAVVRCVPWVKGNDIVVAFHIFRFGSCRIGDLPAYSNGKIFLAAVQRGYSVILPEYEPPGFVKGGLHGKLVMLKG